MKKKKNQRQQFSETFKVRAVKLAKASSQSVSQTARELGISEKTLHSWLVSEASKEQKKTVAGSIAVQSEIETLRAEIADLKEQREILRKAAIFFVKGI